MPFDRNYNETRTRGNIYVKHFLDQGPPAGIITISSV